MRRLGTISFNNCRKGGGVGLLTINTNISTCSTTIGGNIRRMGGDGQDSREEANSNEGISHHSPPLH